MEVVDLSVSLELMKRNMINSQLKPIGVNDDQILSIFEKIPREKFLSEDLQSIAYHDGHIEIKDGRWLLSTATIAQFISSLEYSKSDVILEVGSGVGYCTAILESLSSIVVGVEADKDLRDKANKVIGQIGLESAIIIDGLHNKGHLKSAPYDKIFIFGSIPKVPDEIFKQLAENGNLVSAIKNKDATNSKVIVFTKNKGIISSSILLETFIPAIPGFDENIDFEF